MATKAKPAAPAIPESVLAWSDMLKACDAYAEADRGEALRTEAKEKSATAQAPLTQIAERHFAESNLPPLETVSALASALEWRGRETVKRLEAQGLKGDPLADTKNRLIHAPLQAINKWLAKLPEHATLKARYSQVFQIAGARLGPKAALTYTVKQITDAELAIKLIKSATSAMEKVAAVNFDGDAAHTKVWNENRLAILRHIVGTFKPESAAILKAEIDKVFASPVSDDGEVTAL